MGTTTALFRILVFFAALMLLAANVPVHAQIVSQGIQSTDSAKPKALVKSAPVPTLAYPVANMVFDERLSPTIVLQAAIADVQFGNVTAIFYACEAAGLSCSEPGRIVASVANPPYESAWVLPRRSAVGAITVRYLLWVGAQNSLGEQRMSDPIPITLYQPPPLPSVRLVAPATPAGLVAPAATLLYATAVPGSTSPPSTIARVDFLDGSDLIGSIATPNAVPAGYAFTWSSPAIGAHQIRALATDSLGDQSYSEPVEVFIVPPSLPPRVTLITPRSGQTIAPESEVFLSATARSGQGEIQRVEFVAGNTVVGTALAPPFTAIWQNPPAGSFSVVARAFNDLGIAAASPAAYIEVPTGRRPPAVVVTSPLLGVTLASSTPMTLSASVLDTDFPIARVDFLSGSSVIGSASAKPYSYMWATPSVGALLLSAKAYDTRGGSAQSSPVAVTVASGPTPIVALIAPASGSTFVTSASIDMRATISNFSRPVARIEFLVNGVGVGVAQAPSLTATWSSATSGNYAIVARAVDSSGATVSSAPISIVVAPTTNVPPRVTLVAPVSGANYAEGGPIGLRAEASDTDGRVVRVEFFDGSTPIGTVVTSPYNLTWSGAQIGSHLITAKATDDSGASATSAAASVQIVPINLAVDDGVDGAALSDDHLRVTGSVQAPKNSALILEGREVAMDAQGNYMLDVIDLLPGRNTLTLSLNTLDAAPIRRTITVDSRGGQGGFRVALEPGHGYAPFATKLTIANRANIPFQRITVDSNGDNVPDITLTELPGGEGVINLTMPNPGKYPINVSAYDSTGARIYSTTRTVTVFERSDLGRRVVEAYQTMVARLGAGNITGALRAFTGDMQARYADIFGNLALAVPQVAAQLGNLVDGVVSENAAELTIARDTPAGKELFMIYLIRGGDGIWRIESM